MAQDEDFSFLIVDDDDMNRQILCGHLNGQGYKKIHLASDGIEAISLLNSYKFDLILLDIMMPGANGYQVLEYLKSRITLSKIPVIMISAISDMESVVKCIEMGAEDYLSKPFDKILLRARTNACLDKKRLRDQEEIRIQQLRQANQELSEANKKLELLSRLDGLTGIANRRHFDDVLMQEWKSAIRLQEPLSLIMLDVDFFKQYNDNYGHLVGDDCLRQVTNLIKNTISRPRDLVARYGGEEFAIILPNTHPEGAILIAERVRKGVEMLHIPHLKSKVGAYVTISLGVATAIAYDKASVTTLICNADECLFQAKQEGRNQVKADKPIAEL